MKLTPVIGLETHLQLNTQSKLFCSCKNGGDNDAPNSNVCAICLGHPGTLPSLNEQAVKKAILLSLALNGTVASHAKFDRKNYFYPDLPKAYQISQFDLPIMRDGSVDIGEATIRLERLHLEEDAAKNIHAADGKTLVDFNRSGAPLCEIVTRPDFTSAKQAKSYVEELQNIARVLGVSNADLEKGQMRCDVNISLRPEGETVFYPKTEIKNLNSFRHIERAINYEIMRQTALWEAKTPPASVTTRGWNDQKGETEFQRNKETSADYRFFPEPDLPPLKLDDLAAQLRLTLPELPQKKRLRLINEYGLREVDARFIVSDVALANFVDRVLSEKTHQELFATWLITKLPDLLNKHKLSFATMSLAPEDFREFLALIKQGAITTAKATEVLDNMITTGQGPHDAAKAVGATGPIAELNIPAIINDILASNQAEVTRYRAGETKLLAFFLGLAMRATKGNADPAALRSALLSALDS